MSADTGELSAEILDRDNVFYYLRPRALSMTGVEQSWFVNVVVRVPRSHYACWRIGTTMRIDVIKSTDARYLFEYRVRGDRGQLSWAGMEVL